MCHLGYTKLLQIGDVPMTKENEIREEWKKEYGNLMAYDAWAERSAVPDRERDFVEEARYEGFRRLRGAFTKRMTDAQRGQKKRLLGRLSQTLQDLDYILSYKELLGIEPASGWFRKKDWEGFLNVQYIAKLVRQQSKSTETMQGTNSSGIWNRISNQVRGSWSCVRYSPSCLPPTPPTREDNDLRYHSLGTELLGEVRASMLGSIPVAEQYPRST
jgi:hypothetical protein